ncbi:MAG: hypothetical protein ACOYL1_00655 [Chlamydiia bacterium]
MIINVRGDGRCQTWALIAADLELLPENNELSQSQTFSLNFPGGYDNTGQTPDPRLVCKKDDFDQMIRTALNQSFVTQIPFLPLLKELPGSGVENASLLLATNIFEQIDNTTDMRNPSSIFGSNLSEWPEAVKKLSLVTGDENGNRAKLLNYVKDIYSENRDFLQDFLERILGDQPGILVFNFAQNYLPNSRYAFTFFDMKSNMGTTTLSIRDLQIPEGFRQPQKLIKSFLAHPQTSSQNGGHYKLAIPVTEAIKTAVRNGFSFPEAEFFKKNPSDLVWTKQKTAPTFGGGSAAPASCLAVPKPDAKVIVTQALLEAGIKGDVSALDVIRTAAIQTQEMRKEFQQVILFEKNENVFVVTLYDLDGRETYVRLQPEPLIQQPPKSQPKPDARVCVTLDLLKACEEGDESALQSIRKAAIEKIRRHSSDFQPIISFEKNEEGFTVTLWDLDSRVTYVRLQPEPLIQQPPKSQPKPTVEHSPKGGSCSVM